VTEQLTDFIAGHLQDIEDALRDALPVSSLPHAQRLNDALEYAIFPGGKRLRPALALLASELAGATREQGLLVACALEFLHSSSLILDDLPSMDDAHLRRNRRALHLVFGEALAVLTAVTLLNHSYQLLAQAARSNAQTDSTATLINEASHAIGADGMIGGQVIDLELQDECAGTESLASRDLKTVALMRLMMTAGAHACGAVEEETCALAFFGECFGRAYQVCDDLLDELGASVLTGKPARQDARHLRPSAVTTLGIEGAQHLAAQLIERGIARLHERFGERREVRLLADAARLAIERVNEALLAPCAHLPAHNYGEEARRYERR
jgi:geranylgeranyl diphosphate synthase type II